MKMAERFENDERFVNVERELTQTGECKTVNDRWTHDEQTVNVG